MNSLSITQLARFAGVMPHTIRMWEQRYQALSPARTEGNTRYYDSGDLKRLLNIVSLTDEYKVSELCRMTNIELNTLVEKTFLSTDQNDFGIFISQLLAAGMEFNEASFQHILSHCLQRFGIIKTYKNVLYPLLSRTGLLWSVNQMPPAHEHFMTNLIRQKLLVTIDSLPLQKANAKSWILFLPEDEYHETGLLMASYILRSRGENVLYLGTSVPLDTLKCAVKNFKPDAVLFFLVHNDLQQNIETYFGKLLRTTASSKVYVASDKKLQQIPMPPKIKWLQNIEDL